MKNRQINLKPAIRIVVLTVLVIAGFGIAESIMAQPGLPSSPDQAPIDGGLGLLAAAGGAYAIKKLRDSKKK